MDGVYDDSEYRSQKQLIEAELESLVFPEANADSEPGRLIERLPELWSGASLEERRKLLMTMLDAVYVDTAAYANTKEARRTVAIQPAPLAAGDGRPDVGDGAEASR